MTQNFSGNKNPLIIFATYKPSAIVIDMKNSWFNLEKKAKKSGKKIISEYHENFFHGQFDPCGLRKNGFVTTRWRPGAREQKKTSKRQKIPLRTK